MSDISFFHIASVYRKATEFVVSNVRKHHPDSFYFLGVDATESFDYLTEPYNLHYRYYTNKVGGPKGDYGYRLEGTLEFLRRFKEACDACKTSHIMMLEDDVILLKPVTVRDEWEHVGADTKIGNLISYAVLKMIEKHSGKYPNSTQYGAGGGSIFKVSTFIDNYDMIVEWFKTNFDEIQKYYPTIGYIDCFMNIVYFLCGKNYSANTHRADTHNHHAGFDYENFISHLSSDIEILNNYKKYYYE